MDNVERLFNEIVKDYSERVYWHVRRFVNSHEDADDLVQDIFLKIWTALPSFRGEAQLFTWIWRIATNETLNWLRREKVRAALRFSTIDAEMERRIDSDPFFDGDAADRALSKAVARLPEKQRQVFISAITTKFPTKRCPKSWAPPWVRSRPPTISHRKKSAPPWENLTEAIKPSPPTSCLNECL